MGSDVGGDVGSARRQTWAEAFDDLASRDAGAGLDVAELERLAVSAHMVGRVEESVRAWERAHRAYAEGGQIVPATRCAFWLAFVLLNDGAHARGGGWVLRAQRLLNEADIDCVEHGYLHYLAALRHAFEGDATAAATGFAEAAGIGDHFRAMELVALARAGQGRCLIGLGRTAEGVALLDEAMAVITGENVSPTTMGDLYCTVIEGCQQVFDVRRAQEWTEALDRWCDVESEPVFYHGQCLIHRAELMAMQGAWSQAVREIDRACARLSRPRNHPALGSAFYLRADLHRLRGEFDEADDAYRQANTFGHQLQPGLALLRLAQGRIEEADAALRRAISLAVGDDVERCKLLAPQVEAALAMGDVAAARHAADDLATIAARLATPLVLARSRCAEGSVLLAEGDPMLALTALRAAWEGWVELEAPHDAARCRLLIGLACHDLGDDAKAAMELVAARAELTRLGATPDGLDLAGRISPPPPHDVDGLTPREVDVVRQLATGMTNRDIASALFISERTVATHVSSILRKLGLSSRSAVTAFAHRRHLV